MYLIREQQNTSILSLNAHMTSTLGHTIFFYTPKMTET